MQSVRHLHVGMYGAVMGLAGLGLSARAAATLFPGVVRAPAYVTEPWVALGALALLVLVSSYAVKIVRYPDAVREDFTNPTHLGFCAALPVGMSLVAGGIGPYSPALGDALWWSAFALLVAFQAWSLSRWLAGGVDLAHVNAGWMIMLVGGIVLPGPGLALGHVEASRFIFGVSATLTPIVVALMFVRAVTGPPLPEPLRPSWFILLVPPSLIYANGAALAGGAGPFLEGLFYCGLVLAAALLLKSRFFLSWGFGPGWWAFTFPLDALAYAAVHYAQGHPSLLWKTIAAAALLLATFFVLLVLLKTLSALARGALLAQPATPRSAASRAA